MDNKSFIQDMYYTVFLHILLSRAVIFCVLSAVGMLKNIIVIKKG